MQQAAARRRDRKLLRQLASGNMTALAGLYDAHADRLFGAALWITRSHPDAEEVVQNVFVKLAGMGEPLLAIRRPDLYLLRMARTEAYDLLARPERRHEHLDGTALDPDLFAADGLDPSSLVEAAALQSRIGELEPSQREALFLRVYEGLTFRRIGQIMGVGTFTAASRYRLAIEKIRKSLDPQRTQERRSDD